MPAAGTAARPPAKLSPPPLTYFRLARGVRLLYNSGRMAVDVRIYTGGPAACNAYLIKGRSGYVAVDAPLGFADWVSRRLPEGAVLTDLLITHQHFDHVDDAARLKELTGCRIHAHSPYSPELTLEKAAAAWGLEPPPPFVVDDAFGSDHTAADWGGLDWTLHHIPGHAMDGMAYQLADAELLFVGDILFAGSIGRTDFPGGSMATLVRGIRDKLMVQEPATRVYCGHGPYTTLQEEMLNNPYVS